MSFYDDASLIMYPSGYKEDKIYSLKPTDGSGDLTFTRASTATRVNAEGLIEESPYNLLQQSSIFNISPWAFVGGCTLTGGFADVNGGTNAFRFQTTASSYKYGYNVISSNAGQAYTHSIYAKCISGTQQFKLNDAAQGGGSLRTVTTEWQRFTFTLTSSGSNVAIEIGNDGTNALDIYICFSQTNIGATAKPYFPTTDRLNVPRIDYTGGGCGKLLLEPQRTNLVSYSQDFTNAYWSKLGQGVGSTSVVTANYAISPDGTQNATRFVCNLNGGTTSSDRSWMIVSFSAPATSTISIWIKLNSAGTKTLIFSDSGGDAKTISGTDWQRIDATFVGSGGEFRIGLIGGSTSDTLDCSIWGAQAEAGSYSTSLIPTLASSVTRLADAASKTGISSLIGQTEGTVFVDWIMNHESPNTSEDLYTLTMSDGTGNKLIGVNNYNQILAVFIKDTTTQFFSNAYTGGADGARIKLALGYANNDVALYINGTQIATDSSATIPTLSQIRLNTFWNGNFPDSSSVNQLLLFQTRLSNAELATLTTI